MSDINKGFYITRDADASMFKVWDEAIQCKDGIWERAEMLFTRRELNFLGIPDKVLFVALNECVYVELSMCFPYHET